MVRVFISHSSEDERLVALLVSLLRAAITLSAEDIRCTSVDGYRLPGGADTPHRLRLEVHEAHAFICVISPASIRSTYVIFELGARWGSGKPLLPVLAPRASAELLVGPLQNINALRLDSRAQLHQIVFDLGKMLDTPPEPAAAYESAVAALLAFRDKRRTSSKTMQAEPSAHGSVLRRKWFFLSGCGVGNKFAVLPLSGDTGSMVELLDALTAAGLNKNQHFATLSRVLRSAATLKKQTKEARALIEACFEAMTRMPEVARTVGNDEEFALFTLGRLLYEFPTLLLAGSSADELWSAITAFESMIHQSGLAFKLQTELRIYADSIRHGMAGNDALIKANDISVAIHMVL